MRARRAGTPPQRQLVAVVARRGWQRRYRCLPRAQPGPERSGGTRPSHAVRLSRTLPRNLVSFPDSVSPVAGTARAIDERDEFGVDPLGAQPIDRLLAEPLFLVREPGLTHVGEAEQRILERAERPVSA